MDDVLKEVMDEALSARDRGEKPDMDFVYKKTQDKMYEAQHGKPPPSKLSNHEAHIPPAPEELRRLIPCSLFDDDPWPVRADPRGDTHSADEPCEVPETSPHGEVEVLSDKQRAFIDDFVDASDELAHWEQHYLEFLRDKPLGLRRTLPLLYDNYGRLTHRVIRAEKRFLKARDAVVGSGAKVPPKYFADTESRVERLRLMYVETHKSLTQATYDPVKMNKAWTGKLLRMTNGEFQEWLDKDRGARNLMVAGFDE